MSSHYVFQISPHQFFPKRIDTTYEIRSMKDSHRFSLLNETHLALIKTINLAQNHPLQNETHLALKHLELMEIQRSPSCSPHQIVVDHIPLMDYYIPPIAGVIDLAHEQARCSVTDLKLYAPIQKRKATLEVDLHSHIISKDFYQ